MVRFIKRLLPVAKTVVAAVGAGLVAIAAATTDDVITTEEWITIGIAVATGAGVYFVPNKPKA